MLRTARRSFVTFRYPRAYTSQLHMELLEDRTMPSSGLYYWANGERIELTAVPNEYAVSLQNGDAQRNSPSSPPPADSSPATRLMSR